MKKGIKGNICIALGIMLVLGSFLFAGCDGGSVFNGKQAVPDAASRLEAAGWDLRMYEFTPSTAPDVTCVFVAGTNKAGLDCFRKMEYRSNKVVIQ